jgi:hypothetical protein
MNWLSISTYALAACGATLGLYLALTGRPFPRWLRAKLSATSEGRRLMGIGWVLFFLAIVILDWGVDEPQRGLTLLAVPLLLLPALILSLRERAQPKGPQFSVRESSSE